MTRSTREVARTHVGLLLAVSLPLVLSLTVWEVMLQAMGASVALEGPTTDLVGRALELALMAYGPLVVLGLAGAWIAVALRRPTLAWCLAGAPALSVAVIAALLAWRALQLQTGWGL